MPEHNPAGKPSPALTEIVDEVIAHNDRAICRTTGVAPVKSAAPPDLVLSEVVDELIEFTAKAVPAEGQPNGAAGPAHAPSVAPRT
jgi:hypothetical protein